MYQPEVIVVAAMSDHESINDALIACVRACGGSKVVGVALWPVKGLDAARNYLLDCLNVDRPAKLGPEEVMFVFRMAREKGCHEGIRFMAASLSYSMPIPVEPKDELADLLRQYLQRRELDTKKDERLERMLAQHLSPTQLRSAA